MSPFSPTREADALEGELRAKGTRKRAVGEKRYLKSDCEHLGATVPQTRRAAQALAREHTEVSHGELIATVEALWSKPVFERRQAAAFLLEARPDLVRPGDLKLLERLVRESGTWAIVDELAGVVLSELLLRNPRSASRLDRWARDDDFWLRRSALLAWLRPLKQGAPFGRFAGYADSMLEEKEFFIRKAIGWVLREASKTRPDEVAAWVAPRTGRASGVTMREAVKYLDEADRERLMAAYTEKRAAA